MDTLDRVVNTRVSLTVGPIDLPSLDQLRRSVVSLAAFGPPARIGLVLAGNHWDYVGEGIADRVAEVVRRPPGETPSLRQWIEATWVPDLPIQFAVTNDRIGFVADHRLMDGNLATEIIPILLSLARGDAELDLLRGHTAHPLASAVANTLIRCPGRVARLAGHLRRQQSAPPPALEGTALQPFAGSPDHHGAGIQHTVMAMDREPLLALRAWLRGRVSFSPALVLLAAAALRSVGLPVARYGAMVVDLRRYLPPGVTTSGNFIAGMPLPLWGQAGRPEALEAFVTESLEVGRPLLATVNKLAKTRLSGLAPFRPPVRQRDPSGELAIGVSVSNSGLLRSIDRLPWLAPSGSRCVEVLGDAVDPAGIGFLTCMADGRLWIGGTYLTEYLDPSLVRTAMEAMVQRPAQLLAHDWLGE